MRRGGRDPYGRGTSRDRRGGGTAGRRVVITDLSATIILTLILINHLVFAIFMQVYQFTGDRPFWFRSGWKIAH